MTTQEQRIYWVWWEMRRRCSDPRSRQYKDYGGRGILVCDRWTSFSKFKEDMGFPPKGGLLDRADNDGNYEPSNCRWADLAGERVTLKEACRRTGLKYRAVHKRIVDRGWDATRALSTPIGKGNTHANY